MKIGLIEDNIQAVELMESMIREHFDDLDYIGHMGTVEDGMELIREHRPEILLVDIQLKDGTIFDLLENLPRVYLEDTSLIFITAYGTVENIYRALRLSAIDYLIKPIDEEHFITAIQEAMNNGEKHGIENQIEYFLDAVQKGVQNLRLPKMPIYLAKGLIEFTSWEDIIYIRGEDNVSYFHLIDGRRLTSIRNVGFYYQAVEDSGLFFQISKSQLINMRHLERYDHSNQTVEMACKIKVLASRRGGMKLFQHLKGMME